MDQPPNPRSASHGRGGAGNINVDRTAAETSDLSTPELKTLNYTTGRGGTGNIVSNESAANARKAQDVDAPVHHESKGVFHWGRGGEGNKINVGSEDAEKLPSSKDGAQRRGSFNAALEKGKEMLGLGKHKEKDAGEAVAQGNGA